MTKRLRAIYTRYGWRMPFVVLALGANRLQSLRSALFTMWLRLLTRGHKERGTYFGKGIKVSPGCWLSVGRGGYMGDRCAFDVLVASGARVEIGRDTWISHDCHIVSQNSIRIGSQVLVGEFVSIRDSTHAHANVEVPIKHQGDIAGSITIEDNVWIGRGTLIQGRPEGITIGRGAIVGANSFVSRSVPSHAIVAGAPARLIRFRAGSSGHSNTPQTPPESQAEPQGSGGASLG